MTNCFLASWSDLSETESDAYIDYDTLINSDDEYLALGSLFSDIEVDYV